MACDVEWFGLLYLAPCSGGTRSVLQKKACKQLTYVERKGARLGKCKNKLSDDVIRSVVLNCKRLDEIICCTT